MPYQPCDLQRIVVVTGHYGSGKTNLSINLALDLRRQGREVVLADLDVVNPYFRTADFRELAESEGIRLITPNYANSNLDIPSLTGELDARLGEDATVVVDVGGDDAGAFALGRYAPRILDGPYDMLYVVNCYRYLTRTPEEAALLLEEIETASRLRATGIVNNSNLSHETTTEDIVKSLPFAGQVARQTGKPLLFTAVERRLWEELRCLEPDAAGDGKDYYPVEKYVTLPWK